MTRVVLYRLAMAPVLLFVISVLTFVLVSLIPGDAARTILGDSSNAATYEALREQLGLDDPLWERYGAWLGGVLTGDLGTSIVTRQDVGTIIAQRLPVTLSLVLLTSAACAIMGVALGVLSSRRGGALGRVVDVLSLGGIALPAFWVGLVLVLFLAVYVPVFPATGYLPATESVSGWLWYLTLPVLALTVTRVADVVKQSRDSLREQLDRPYIRTLRAAGVSEPSVMFRHALRNASGPILAVVGLVFVASLGGAVFVENVFVLPGLGSLAVTSTLAHDLPVITIIAVTFTLLTVIANLVIDVTSGILDPRARAR